MALLAMAAFLDSEFGEPMEFPHGGSALEHPLAFDLAAREIKALAKQGRARIVHEHHVPASGGTGLIDRLVCKRPH